MPDSELVLPDVPKGPLTVLYHFSEDPDIDLFRPRRSRPLPGFPGGRDVVWAIDEHHAPMYYFPRDCPRIVLWALAHSSPADVAHWMGANPTRMAIFIEARWRPALGQCRLYRYAFDPDNFEDTGDHGTHVSPATVRPISVEPVGPLAPRLAAAGAALNVVESLAPMREAVDSTLHFSGIRLRNSETWPREGRTRG